MKLLSGNSNKPLSKNIAKYLKSKLVNSSIRNFSDGEIYIEINENIRGNSIFIIQSVSSPANDNLMELLLCIDALKRSSAKNITAVIPYFGYARQDRKVVPRTSISAKLVSNLITKALVIRFETSFAEMEVLGTTFLSCLAYPKYGITAVIFFADDLFNASIQSKSFYFVLMH